MGPGEGTFPGPSTDIPPPISILAVQAVVLSQEVPGKSADSLHISYGIIPVLHIATGGSSRTREWAAITGKMGFASPFITFLNIKYMQNMENMLNMHNMQDTYMHVTNQGTQIMLKDISTICEICKICTICRIC